MADRQTEIVKEANNLLLKMERDEEGCECPMTVARKLYQSIVELAYEVPTNSIYDYIEVSGDFTATAPDGYEWTASSLSELEDEMRGYYELEEGRMRFLEEALSAF